MQNTSLMQIKQEIEQGQSSLEIFNKTELGMRLKNELEIVKSIHEVTNILFLISLIPAILLYKKYKDKKSLTLWIISLIFYGSVYIAGIVEGVPESEASFYRIKIRLEIIGIIAGIIPFIYSCIKLIINKYKDNKTSKGEI